MWEQTTRFFGAYSSRSRGAAKQRERLSAITNGSPLPEPIVKPSATWARLIKKVFEFDPLLWPKCHGSMKIRAFITDTNEIRRIAKNLNIPNQRAPPDLQFSSPLAV
jgi:hypothetical protein